MAGKGRKPDLSGYNYDAILSLVREMRGSHVVREAPKDIDKKKKKAAEQVLKGDEGEKKPKRRAAAEAEAIPGALGYSDIIEATQDIEDLAYRPRTEETRTVYQLMLASVHSSLGDQAQDVVGATTDIVLETLKNGSMRDFDKKKEVEDVLGQSVSREQFAQLINLSKKLTDFNAGAADVGGGVNVVFDDDNDSAPLVPEGFDAAIEELVIGNAPNSTSTKVDKDIVSPRSIDGFWVQRQISEIYPDPVTVADKANAVLTILGSESSARDAENQLMELFDFESFHIVARFIKNRDGVLWCTKFMRSDADERVNVEVAMREKGLGWILRELAGNGQVRPAGDEMDVDS